MCSHYETVKAPARLTQAFGVELPPDVKTDVWPGYASVFIRRPRALESADEAVPQREAMAGVFGMIPHWAKDEKVARRTYNARSETAAEKPSFRDAWRLARHCIIPAEAIFEPDWRSGKAIATRISRRDGQPMGIAGLWTGWKGPDGRVIRSMTMLTVNADAHSLMRNYHKPDDEKRMVVILPQAQYDEWLDAPADRSMAFMNPFPAELLVGSVA